MEYYEYIEDVYSKLKFNPIILDKEGEMIELTKEGF